MIYCKNMNNENINSTLRSITIKPVLACNANCLFCEQRKEHYKRFQSGSNLTLDKWREIIDEAVDLGAKYVNISGGEPTLCRYLLELIDYCKDKGVEAHLKTNGYIIDRKFADKLAATGLDSCTVSLYSHDACLHDQLRGLKGSHAAAVKAIEYLVDSGISTHIQTILTSDLISNFDKYLEWVSKLKINTLFLSYLEGGRDIKRPTEGEILDFIKNVKPRSKKLLLKLLDDKAILKEDLKEIDNLFNFENISYKEIAAGIYNPSGLKGCGRNYSMAMVLANGEVHPCNAVEYFHEPVVGNLMEESLTESWQSERWKAVRKSGLKYCTICPMTRHAFIKFTDKKAAPFYSSL